MELLISFICGIAVAALFAYCFFELGKSQQELPKESIDKRPVLEMLIKGDDGEFTLVNIHVSGQDHAQRMLNMHNLFNVAAAKVWDPIECNYIASMGKDGVLRGFR